MSEHFKYQPERERSPPRPRLLDLFCAEGGASTGYARAGFDVTGVDLFIDTSQSRYPFRSVRADALVYLEEHGHEYDVIVASPPCQRYSITNAARRADYPDLVDAVREQLVATGKPYVIENVIGAPLRNPTELCGCMFDMRATDTDGLTVNLRRRRIFESNIVLAQPRAHHHAGQTWIAGVYGGARRDKYEAKHVRRGGYVPASKRVAQRLLGIDWMTWKGMHQAIPPIYTDWIGQQLIAHLDSTASPERLEVA